MIEIHHVIYVAFYENILIIYVLCFSYKDCIVLDDDGDDHHHNDTQEER